MTKISRELLSSDVELSGDVYIRGVAVKYSPDMIYLIITLGPTPIKIIDNPEEFEVDQTLNIKPGTPLRHIVQALYDLMSKNLDIFVWRSHVPN